MHARHLRRILATVLLACLALLTVPRAARADDKLTLSGDTLTVYVQAGAESSVQVKVTNNSGALIKGVTLCASSTVDSVTYTDDDGNSYHPERFSRGDENGQYGAYGLLMAASGATHEYDQQGYRIAKGRTATFTIRLNTYEEKAGTYTEWVQFGDIEFYDTTEDGRTVTRVRTAETYSAQIPIKVVVYNPKNAALSFGTSTNGGKTITAAPSTIDLGTVSLTNESALESSETYYVKNVSPTGDDEHGNSSDIAVEVGIEDPYASPIYVSGGSNYAPLEPATSSSFTYIPVTLGFDATRYIAGTYTNNLTLETVPHGVKVNGGAIQNSGRYAYPVKITLTGTNPRLPARVSTLTAKPGNGQVELTFTAQDGASSYDVYRRTGAESQTNPDKLDWSRYEKIETVYPDRDEGTVLFVDGTVENGTTYTYTVICGEPYQGYAAKPASAKPLASLESKLLAPEGVHANEGVDVVELSWKMNELYGGNANDGASMVDHFNIYRDNLLVAQLDRSAVDDNVSYGWVSDDGGESYHYGVSGHSYSWSIEVETPQPYIDYVWNIAAVTQSGVEGYWSEDVIWSSSAGRPVVLSHTAQYDSGFEVTYDETTDDYVETPALMLSVEAQEYAKSIEGSKWWRVASAKAPDTSKAPYKTFDSNADEPCVLNDTGVTAGKTYTYTVCVQDQDGVWSDPYTFTAKAVETVGEDYIDFSPVEVTWRVASGTTASLSFSVESTCTYKVYRNNTSIKTYSKTDDYVTFKNNPGIDGTYTYRVDKIVSGVTVRGREYTFVRNTAPVDESAFGQAPDAPTLMARTSGDKVVLTWVSASTGGEPEGYYIYRRDAGEYLAGTYTAVRESWNGSSTYTKAWGNSRYLKVQDPDTYTLVDGVSGSYLGDASLGTLQGIAWDENYLPHEWYVTAYNARGESAASNVIVYDTASEDEYGNATAPANEESEVKPGKPTISDLWVEWEDSSTEDWWVSSLLGHVRVAWNDVPGRDIDQWNVYTTGTSTQWTNPEDPDVLEYWEAAVDTSLTKGAKDFVRASIYTNAAADRSDVGRMVTVSVEAVNSAGSARSDAAEIVVRSAPRFRVLADNGGALLEWTDLVDDMSTQVSTWEIWRKREYGSWECVETLAAPREYAATDDDGVSYYAWHDGGVENNWTYQYKVVATCADGVDRASVEREVTPVSTAATEAPGPMSNLTASVTNGTVFFNWNEPTTGGVPEGYQVMYEDWINYPDGGYWRVASGGSLGPGSTGCTWQPTKAGTYRCFVYAYNYVRGERKPKGSYEEVDPALFKEVYPTASNIVEVTLTEEDIAQQSTEVAYGDMDLTLTPGEGQVTLTWKGLTGATYYEISRVNNDYPKMATVTVPAEAGKETYTYVDTTAIPGVKYRYMVSATAGSSGYYRDGYATALGTTKNETIASEVEALIEALPDPAAVTQEDADAVSAVAEVWDALTDVQKKLVDDELAAKLESDVEKIEAQSLAEEYGDLVAQVQALIDALPAPEDVTLADSAAIRAARAALNGTLPKKVRPLVDTTRLEADEAALAELQKYAQYAEAAMAVQSQIDALPDADAVTLDDAEAIEAARAAYDALTPEDAKKLVQTKRLEEAEAALELRRLEAQYAEQAAAVQELIDALPPAVAVRLEHAEAIEAARAAYDALTPEEAKKLVDTTKLTEAEAALAAARQAAAGSDLANATIDPIDDQIWFGGEVVPEVVVRMKDVMLAEGVDYTLAFAGNDAAGTATVTATGAGSYQGSVQTTFAIIFPFTDVNAQTAHMDKILWLAGAGITRGWGEIPNAEFRPNDNVKRGDMAAFLFRLAKLWGALDASDDWQPSDATRGTFTDVTEGTAHAQAIWWMAEHGISTGWVLGDGTAEFRPNANVKRGDLAAFLGRLAEKAGVGTGIAGDPSAFVDVDEGTAHHEKIWWMASAGISTGWSRGDGTAEFRPNAEVKRGDMAAFLQRLNGLV